MKKLIAMLAAGVVLSGVAMGRSTQAAAEVEVQAKIDARLHDLLIQARLQRHR